MIGSQSTWKLEAVNQPKESGQQGEVEKTYSQMIFGGLTEIVQRQANLSCCIFCQNDPMLFTTNQPKPY